LNAIRVLRDEHRELATVLGVLARAVRGVRAGTPADFELLRSIVHYVETFPDRLHHPKEDGILFARLRARGATLAPVLERLQDEHRAGAAKTCRLARALHRYEHDGDVAAFAAIAADYTTFQRDHMHREETLVLPFAKRLLTPADRAAIDAAFRDADYDEAATRACDALLERIVSLAPASTAVASSSIFAG
jgi:hemerythrin-like domain-containing protein